LENDGGDKKDRVAPEICDIADDDYNDDDDDDDDDDYDNDDEDDYEHYDYEDMDDENDDDDNHDMDYSLPTANPKHDVREHHFENIGTYGEDAYVTEEKFVVFERNLYQLFSKIPCQECGELFNTVGKNQRKVGTILKLRGVCKNHHVFYWNSQPIHQKAPLGNILCSSSILFSGNTFAALNKYARVFNLRMISKSTFMQEQTLYLFPIINSAWKN
jgi:hypothetical protein